MADEHEGGEPIELEPQYASREDIPEAFRSAYRESDDGFVLNLSRASGKRIEDVDGLKRTLSERKQKHLASQRRAEALEAELAELREKAADAPAKNSKADDDRIRQVTEKYEAQIKGERGLLEKRTGQLQGVLVKEGILRHLPEGADKDVLLPALQGLVRTVEVDGELMTKVYETAESSTPLMSMREGSTEDMQLSEFMSSVVPVRFKKWFPAPDASGGGALGSDGGSGRTSSGGEFAISAEDARDPAKYRAARARAAKAGKVPTIVRT